jgi:signal transduction histidine kinase
VNDARSVATAEPAPAIRPADTKLSRLIGYAGLVGLAIILLIFASLSWNVRERVERDVARDLRSVAFSLADHAARLLEVSDIGLRGAAAAVGSTDWDVVASSPELWRQIAAMKAALPYVEDVWLNDAEGRLRLTTFAYPAPASNVADRDAFKAQREPNDRLFIGERIVGRVTGRPTFLLAKRLSGPDGAFRGMVSITANLAYVSNYWARVRLPPGARVTLFRSDFSILAQHPDPNGAFMPLDAESLRPAVAASPDSGFVETSGERGRGAVFKAYDRVGELPLYIAVATASASVRQTWRDTVLGYALFAGAAFAALALLAFLAFRQASREARAAAELAEARAALVETNAGLEDAVAERTAELRDSNEEIQRFAYIVSHDLRSPLVNIMGFTTELEALRADLFRRLGELRAAAPEPGDPDAELGRDFDEAIGFIKASIAKMDRLINAILRLSREGRREFHPERIDMTALLGSITASLAHQAEAAGATVIVGELPPVTSDRLALEQIFSNLVDNALKYGRAGAPGRIEVAGRVTPAGTVYEVRDNGRGIDARDRERVFDLFRRSGVQDRPGEGIGLAHVRALVRRLGGTIVLTSEPGQGSTFTVTLPRRWAGEMKRKAA